jgi:hypothetical protein
VGHARRRPVERPLWSHRVGSKGAARRAINIAQAELLDRLIEGLQASQKLEGRRQK